MSEESIETEIQAKGLTAARITPQMIDDQIAAEYFMNAKNALDALGCPVDSRLKVLTICVLVLKNGYVVTGESACASPENYDDEIGCKIAFENARNKIWALEGYLLKSIISGRAGWTNGDDENGACNT